MVMFEKGTCKSTSKNFSLARLRSLVDVSRAGYILKAAKGNETNANKISRQIGELESFFGRVALRAKKGKLKGLSAEGTELAKIAETFLTSMQNFQDKVDGIVPSITLGSGETFLSSVLLPSFSKLRDSSSGNKIQLCNMRSSELPDALDRGEVDLMIVSEKRLVKNDQRKVLGRLEYRLYAPLSLEGVSKYKTSRLDMISELPFATLSGQGERRTYVENLLRKKNKTPNIQLECSSHIEMLEAVKSGCFCAILPTFLAKELTVPDFGSFVVPALKEMHGKLCIAWRKETCHFKPDILAVATKIQEVTKKCFAAK
jgi:DNA-binding transcriptional LysR family regulator